MVKEDRRIHGPFGIFILLVSFAFLVLFSPGQSSADLIKSSHFDLAITQPSTASISYGGSNGPLTGTGISVDRVVGINKTPNDLQTVNNGIMQFTTGKLLNFSTIGQVSYWTFDKGGSLTLTDGIPGISGIPDDSSLIYNGAFSSMVVISVPVYDSLKFCTAVASFYDQKNNTLATHYGFEEDLSWVGNFNISFYATQSPDGVFQSTQVLTGAISPIPPSPSPPQPGCSGRV